MIIHVLEKFKHFSFFGGGGGTECRSLNLQKRGILRTFLSRSSTQSSFELQYCISSDLVLLYVNVVYDPGKGNRPFKVLQCTHTMKDYPSVTIFMWYFLKASLIYSYNWIKVILKAEVRVSKLEHLEISRNILKKCEIVPFFFYPWRLFFIIFKKSI